VPSFTVLKLGYHAITATYKLIILLNKMAPEAYKLIKYLTVPPEIKNWGLYISGAGNLRIGKEVNYPLKDDPTHHYFHYSTGRRISKYQILYITKGKGIFESEHTGVKKISTGDLFVLVPGVWHRFKPDKKTGWDEYWVEFDGAIIKHCQFYEVLDKYNPIIHLGVYAEIIEYFNQLINTIIDEKPGFQHIASGNLFQIFAQIFAFKKYHVFEGKMIENQIEQAKSYISENLTENISQTKVALEVGLGYSLYRKKFREYTGLSPCQYQIHLKINKAKGLLISTKISLQEIADQLGFDSSDYFYRIFKKKVGLTPSEYRTKNLR
jgi:AraC-like DNA-binding protein/mannose-6-phosphate isomerase-like protein (cupin superfamily)